MGSTYRRTNWTPTGCRNISTSSFPKQFSNDTAGLKLLISWAQRAEVSLVVFEATGICHRWLETALAAHDLAFARVDPRQARRFCEGAGQLAKTDRVDAAMLAKMGAVLELKADQARSETLHDLKQLAAIPRQSGKWRGKERIQGGRANLRRAIYLPAIAATRFNPAMKAKYEQLISAGKCKKQAITAVMRNLIVMANAL